MELTKATDDEIEISLDLDDLVVHLWRSNTPGTVKGMSHKDIALRRAAGVGFNERKTEVSHDGSMKRLKGMI